MEQRFSLKGSKSSSCSSAAASPGHGTSPLGLTKPEKLTRSHVAGSPADSGGAPTETHGVLESSSELEPCVADSGSDSEQSVDSSSGVVDLNSGSRKKPPAGLASQLLATSTFVNFGVTIPRRIMVLFSFFRALSSPSGHEWQYAQLFPFLQLPGFQNQAQGWQPADAWSTEPWLGVPTGGGRPGGTPCNTWSLGKCRSSRYIVWGCLAI